ncbi:MAG: hypothetical protein JO072_04470 [Parafilimonas sp.]|nr:hypothetical protein [Parafilimonas sp.]
MRKAFQITCLFAGFTFIFCIAQCKKDSGYVNIILYNKPLSEIQSHIQGKWKLHYTMGGFCGTCKSDRELYNEYYEFLPNDRIRYTFQDTLLADAIINWLRYKPNGYSDSISVMEFYDKRFSPNYFEPDRIVNDTLILVSPDRFTADAISYYLTKSN